jgi:hypothetical protein
MLQIDERRAVKSIPALLKGHEKEAPRWLEYVRKIATAGGPLSEAAAKRLKEMEKIFTAKRGEFKS